MVILNFLLILLKCSCAKISTPTVIFHVHRKIRCYNFIHVIQLRSVYFYLGIKNGYSDGCWRQSKSSHRHWTDRRGIYTGKIRLLKDTKPRNEKIVGSI